MNLLADNLNQVVNKKVLVRCNFDVPIEKNQVQDTTRIEDAISTISALLTHHAQVILLAHYDRPEGLYDPQKSLQPVVVVLETLLHQPVHFVPYMPNYHHLSLPPDAPIVLIDNLRFWQEEEANTLNFAQFLASLGEIYVNQAFANCHRLHASMVLLPTLLPAFLGLNLAKEIDVLNKIRNQPDKPLVVIIGGSKLETKEPLIEVFADKADSILVGGKCALDLRTRSKLPGNIFIADLLPSGKDITETSAQQFAHLIKNAKTVIWNGTMGVYEDPEFILGTKIVAEAVNQTPAFTLIGGGDTETALTLLNLEQGIDFISTGGGAMLEYLSQGTLPALEIFT